ncbi:fumarylacetoacetate hydrolase family protein [Saccharothrix deserti]|uniref:fumarylacetoacetate hydrolase family protein n=1 Tax=Saccharothrix deserti TaxID=2593674 RepID=UPI00131BEEEF|nr:fumarylacetoacetate hydrolase family protein [Saccharothrix deserti]
MSTSVLRTADAWWVHTREGAVRIDTDAETTAQLLADRRAIEGATGDAVPVASLSLLSPVTVPCRVVAQMTNFVSHVRDAGMNPDTVPLTFFRKSSGSISGPHDDVVKPAHVRLLDYEVEIGLVFGASMPVGTDVTADNLADHIAGLVVTDDGAIDLGRQRTTVRWTR